VIIKGKSVGGGKRLAAHLMRTDTNERAEVREITGVAADDLRGALLEMEAVASGTRTTKPFYHASINTRADEKLTDEQRAHAIERLEEKLGLSGQPRVIVVHEKEGREHCHIVWSRIDLDRMAAISDSYNYRKHEEVARDLEREFGHERVQGAHAERDGKQRPDRTPSHEEMLQADRGAVSPEEAKALVTDLWRRTFNGQTFKSALEKEDWLLARGDRRDFVVIDPNGGTHSLARRVEGAKARDIRVRMTDVNPELLPSVAEARAIQRERQAERQSRAHEVSPKVAETEPKPEVKKAPPPKPKRIERPQPQPEPKPARQVQSERPHLDEGRTFGEPQRPGLPSGGLHVIDAATGLVSTLGDFLLGLLSGSSPQPKRPDPNDPATRAQQQVERLVASRRAEAAFDNIRRDIEAGRNLKSEDIKNLTPQHREQMRGGDDAVRQMIDDARKYSERYWKGEERERERER
jgi:Relaxase/Mobilisation nuclease domain